MATITAAVPTATGVEGATFTTDFNVNGALTDEARVRIRLEGWGANEDDYSNVTVTVTDGTTSSLASIGADGYITLAAGTTKITVKVALTDDGLGEQPEMLAVILEQGTDPLTISQLQDSYWLSSVVTITDPASAQPSGPTSTNGDDDVTADGSFSGGTGNDSVSGAGNADTLSGGDGNDTIAGMAGNDMLAGEEGNDEVSGGDGADTITGGNGEDLLSGDGGNDSLNGGNGQDTLLGGAGDDAIDGSNGQDSLEGEGGKDTLLGGLDADTLIGGGDADRLDGGHGQDILEGGSGDDTLLGEFDSDTLIGGEGTDSMLGGAGDDVFIIGTGDIPASPAAIVETIVGGDGFDAVETSISVADMAGYDVEVVRAVAGAGNVALNATNVAITLGIRLEGNDGDNTLTGNGAANHLSGGDGNDNLLGGNGNDTMVGGLGNDVLSGGQGSDVFLYESENHLAGDTINGGTGVDTVVIAFVPASGTVSMPTFAAVTDGPVEAIRISNTVSATSPVGINSNLLRIEGHDGGNIITTGAANNLINSMGGNDSVSAGDGNDTVNGGLGDDTVDGGNGNDAISGGDGNDLLSGGAGVDNIDAGVGSDFINGGDGNDVLSGGSGNDTIAGGGGNDSINLGTGTDRVLFGLTGSANGLDSIVGFNPGTGGDVMAFPSQITFNLSSSAVNYFEISSTGNLASAVNSAAISSGITLGITADVVSSTTAAGIKAALGGLETLAPFVRILLVDAGSEVRVFMLENVSTGQNDLAVTQIATLVGISDIAAGTFVTGNFVYNA